MHTKLNSRTHGRLGELASQHATAARLMEGVNRMGYPEGPMLVECLIFALGASDSLCRLRQ